MSFTAEFVCRRCPRRGPTKPSNRERRADQRAYRVLFCAKRGLPSRSVISHEMDQDRERDRNWAWVWDVRPLRGRGFFLGRLSPGSLAPSARRSPGAIHGMAPPGPLGVPFSLGAGWRRIISGAGWRPIISGAGWRRIISGAGWRPIISGAGWRRIISGAGWRRIISGAAWRAVISRGRLACHCLRGRLAPDYLRGWLAPNYFRGRLACHCLRGWLAPDYLRGRLAHSCQAPCQTWPKDCLIPTEKASQI